MKLIRLPRVLDLTGKSRSTIYHEQNTGLMTPPVKLGMQSVAWLEEEILAINRARIAGKSNEEIRQLVTKLVADRKTLSEVTS